LQRRALYFDQIVDRDRVGVGVEVGQFGDQPGAFAARFSQADDAAAANVDAGIAYPLQGVEPVLIGARGDDLAVELGRGVQVVVVVVQPGFFQLFGLPFLEPPPVFMPLAIALMADCH